MPRQRNDEEEVVNVDGALRPIYERSIYEVAKVMGITPQGVWYLEQSALRKLRKAFLERRIVNQKGQRL